MAVLSLALITSCAPPPEYINEEADFGFYERVGVIPFSGLTNDAMAAGKVTSSFITELLMQSAVNVAPAGDFYKTFKETVKSEKTNLPEEITAAEVSALGQAAGVQGVFAGAVRDYGMVRVGSDEFPLVGLIIRFIDCQSGQVVWSYEITRRGGPKFPIFSFGETHTLGELTTSVCRDVAARFARALK
jgi:TolB-like protein